MSSRINREFHIFSMCNWTPWKTTLKLCPCIFNAQTSPFSCSEHELVTLFCYHLVSVQHSQISAPFTCLSSTSFVVASLCIFLSKRLLGPRGPERPSVRPVSYEVWSVFVTSVRVVPFNPTCHPLSSAQAPALLTNLEVIPVTCSSYEARSRNVSWTERCKKILLTHGTSMLPWMLSHL